MITVGIDYNTYKISIALLNNSKIVSVHELKADEEEDWETRFMQLRDHFSKFIIYLDDYYLGEINRVIIEDVPMVNSKRIYYKLTHILAMMRILLDYNLFDYEVVMPRTWKSRIGCVGQSKEDVRQKAEEIYGEKTTKYNQDEIDAICIATVLDT